MAFTFAPYLLLRRPASNVRDYTTDISVIVLNQQFRTALLLAAPVFFYHLKSLQFDANKLSGKEKHTLLKYYNRFCFRPTPFALFSSIALVVWSDKASPTDSEPHKYRPIVSVDQTFQHLLLENAHRHEPGIFERNPFTYRALNEFRFLRTSLNENFSRREYLLQSVAYSTLLGDLLNFCRSGKSIEQITSFISKASRCTMDEASEYAEFLIDAQLLLDYRRLNITGNNILKRVGGKWLQQTLTLLDQPHPFEERHFLELKAELKMLLPEHQQALQTDELSIILRDDKQETLSSEVQAMLRSGLHALAVLTPNEKLPAMSRFVKIFRQQFEDQTIPLLTALDPEVGIGYQEPVYVKDNPLLETLNIAPRISEDNSIDWTKAHSLLLRKWHDLEDEHEQAIVIQSSELESLQAEKEFSTLGMSVLFRRSGDKVLIESAGGINAPALLGRFTIGNPDIAAAAGEMASLQEIQNPDVIFAEILHLADPHTDNINRRVQIWSFELPITAASELPKERQLELSDLYLMVHSDQLFLFSKKHEKIVIPKLSSAYNHSLDRLPLFRFLADLPFQYSRSNLSLELRQFFPGLIFYPRIEYCAVIIHPATWVLGEQHLKGIPESSDNALIWFDELKRRLKLPAQFYIAENDQHLHFHMKEVNEPLFFIQCIKQKKEVVLREFRAGDNIRQYNAFLLPASPMKIPGLQAFSNLKNAILSKTKRTHIPGSEWLYLKIYAPAIGATRLLLRLKPLLRKRYTHGKIRRWFFIRYDDHAPHIRLRMQVNPEAISEILIAFKAKLEDRVQQHVVREYQLNVYNRELERYMAAGIEHTETFFWRSSELVLHFMSHANYPVAKSFLLAFLSVKVIIEIFMPENSDQLQFAYNSYEQFVPEFGDTKIHVELDKKYRELQHEISKTMSGKTDDLLTGSNKTAVNFRKSLHLLRRIIPADDEKLLPYLRSIIHMHINRIFNEQPRKQEMATYYLLYKFLRSDAARSK